MDKNLALIGAGGSSRDMMAHMRQKLTRFVNDKFYIDNNDNILPLSKFDPNEYKILISIGDPVVREQIVNSLPNNTEYFTFIHSTANILDDNIVIGEGSFISAGTIITTNVKIGKHAQINLNSTIAHDCVIKDYFTTAPGVNVSGNCNFGNKVYLGTNSSVREKITITDDVTVGLNSGVVKNINESGVYVGSPAVKIK